MPEFPLQILFHYTSRCLQSMNVSLSAATLMVCPYFYSPTHVLIFYSTIWSIRWKGGSSYREVRLYDAKPDSNFPSFYAKHRCQTPCRRSLWPGRPNTLATTLDPIVLSPGCHSQKTGRSQ